ncbi:MAG: universal stress protein [Phycisphaerales bacterium]|nr:universal stress protein [Phycisphaerales bacterium]
MDRLKTVLAAVDFSMCSSDAFRQATRIAAWNEAELHALHVVNVPAYRPIPHPFIPFDLPTQDQLAHDAYRRWEDFAPACEGKSQARFTVAVGSPRSEILQAVETLKPDLLVMGTTSVLDRKRGIGTIAAACVRRAETKVLLVREEQSGPFKDVAAFVDFSETSREALAQAVRVAAQDGAALHVVHIYDDPWHGVPRTGIITANMPDFDSKLRESVEQRLREFCEPLAHEMNALKANYHGFQHDEHWEGYGSGITGFIARHGVDLAVLGVRSTWNARDFFMGSTAERVCRDAGCSILTIRPVPESK